MKKLYLAVFLSTLFGPSSTQASLIDISGFADLVGQKAKEAKGASLVDLNAKIAGALYLPVWTFHDVAGIDYVEAGFGGELKEGGKASPLLSIAFNLPAISARLWDSEWAKSHVRRSVFPPIWFGPYIKVPVPGNTWIFGNEVGGMASIRIGGNK